MDAHNIQLLMDNYLEKYNYSRNVRDALSSSIKAAVQHNKLYANNVPVSRKKYIRDYWGTCLEEIGWEFKKKVSIKNYEKLIQGLQLQMNREFGEEFANGVINVSMFRLSHAQKSISVYIKILWCMGQIQEPEICPVDRIILSKTKARNSNLVLWGYVNTIDEHRNKFKYIQDAAELSKMSVAMFELVIFQN